MSEESQEHNPFEIPDAVSAAVQDGTSAVRAFRQHDGRTSSEIAQSAGIGIGRMAALEAGATATDEEIDVLAGVLGVPRDLLIDRYAGTKPRNRASHSIPLRD